MTYSTIFIRRFNAVYAYVTPVLGALASKYIFQWIFLRALSLLEDQVTLVLLILLTDQLPSLWYVSYPALSAVPSKFLPGLQCCWLVGPPAGRWRVGDLWFSEAVLHAGFVSERILFLRRDIQDWRSKLLQCNRFLCKRSNRLRGCWLDKVVWWVRYLPAHLLFYFILLSILLLLFFIWLACLVLFCPVLSCYVHSF